MKLPALMLALALAAPAYAAAPVQVVPGPYLDTCVDAVLHGVILRARCLAPDGQYRPTALHVDRCASQITNKDGRLDCVRTWAGVKPQAQGLCNPGSNNGQATTDRRGWPMGRC